MSIHATVVEKIQISPDTCLNVISRVISTIEIRDFRENNRDEHIEAKYRPDHEISKLLPQSV